MQEKDTVDANSLRRLDPVFKLSPDQIDDLANQTALERHASGTVLVREGDTDAWAIFLLKGDVRLSAGGTELGLLSAQAPEAQRPVAPGKPRPATVECCTACEVARIDGDLLDAMVTWGQLAAQEPEVVMSEDGIFTVDKSSWLKKMVQSPTFKNLPPANIEQLLDKLEPIKVRAGDVVIRQGDPGDYFYMIDQGSALVTRQTGDEEDESIELAELTEGRSFGEAALISDKPRNATVSMMSDGILLRLSKEDFLTLLNEPNVEWVSYEEACSLVPGRAQWLDIRLASEYAAGHIPDAINIPVQQLHRRARELSRERIYICYCDNGRRSSAAAFILKQHGVEARVLKGGTDARRSPSGRS
jgi:CRP-like cAMP-binding protein/rhodanese-related sulfurtransferase